MAQQEGDDCPKCGSFAPLYEWDEVDVGIGTFRGNYIYKCETHGEYAYRKGGECIFRDELEVLFVDGPVSP